VALPDEDAAVAIVADQAPLQAVIDALAAVDAIEAGEAKIFKTTPRKVIAEVSAEKPL